MTLCTFDCRPCLLALICQCLVVSRAYVMVGIFKPGFLLLHFFLVAFVTSLGWFFLFFFPFEMTLRAAYCVCMLLVIKRY